MNRSNKEEGAGARLRHEKGSGPDERATSRRSLTTHRREPYAQESSSRPPIDLTSVTEHTRRALYDVVVAVFFDYDAAYSPEEAGLAIYHFAGRWFAVWLDLEALADLPEDVRHQVVRIRKPEAGEKTPGDYGLRFDEA